MDQIDKLLKDLNVNPLIQKAFKKLTPSQKFRVFEKEILSFFIRDIPNFEHLFQLKVAVYQLERTSGKFTICRNHTDLMTQVKYGGSLIFEASLTCVVGVDKDLIREAMDKYMACDKKFFSYVFDEIFDIGDGDDSGAVSYKSFGNLLSVNVWVRSL